MFRVPTRLRAAGGAASQFFADQQHGGEQGALLAATRVRDELLASMGTSAAVSGKSKAAKRSVTGLVGVAPGFRAEAGGRCLARWIAVDPHGPAKSFSIAKYGMVRAFLMAAAYRQEKAQMAFTLKELKSALRKVTRADYPCCGERLAGAAKGLQATP